jgi:hypothetical protein
MGVSGFDHCSDSKVVRVAKAGDAQERPVWNFPRSMVMLVGNQNPIRNQGHRRLVFSHPPLVSVGQ